MTALYVSPQVERVLGVSADAFLRDHVWVRSLHPEDRERAIAVRPRRSNVKKFSSLALVSRDVV